MTRARAVVVAILAVALGLGALMWWLQTRAYYDVLSEGEPGYARLARPDGSTESLLLQDVHAIDSDSSPIRFRICGRLEGGGDALGPAVSYANPRPPNAPGWFDCFDARAIGEALEAGEARALLSAPDVRYGIDRVLAAFPDGRVFLWDQINRCGEAAFNGDPPPEGCPPPPADTRLSYAPDES